MGERGSLYGTGCVTCAIFAVPVAGNPYEEMDEKTDENIRRKRQKMMSLIRRGVLLGRRKRR